MTVLIIEGTYRDQEDTPYPGAFSQILSKLLLVLFWVLIICCYDVLVRPSLWPLPSVALFSFDISVMIYSRHSFSSFLKKLSGG